MDEEGNPNGIVRVITDKSWIYEGQISSDGKGNSTGWGRLIYRLGTCDIGWWDTNKLCGNAAKYGSSGLLQEEGWYELEPNKHRRADRQYENKTASKISAKYDQP